MLFEVVRTRKEGRLLMRFEVQAHGVFTGSLVVQEAYDADLHRNLKMASLIDPATGNQVPGLPPLYDAVLISARQGWWVIGGYESVGVGKCQHFAQSWVLAPIDEIPSPAPPSPPRSDEEILARMAAAAIDQSTAAERKRAARERAKIDAQWPPRPPNPDGS